MSSNHSMKGSRPGGATVTAGAKGKSSSTATGSGSDVAGTLGGGRPAKSRGQPEEKQLDEEGIATKAMLEEIRSLLDNGPQSSHPLKKKGGKKTSSVDRDSPFNVVPEFVKEMQAKDAQRQAALRSKKAPAVSRNDLLSHYLNQPIERVPFSAEEMAKRAINAPYVDTIQRVEQQLWMEEYLQKHRDKALENVPGPGPGAGGHPDVASENNTKPALLPESKAAASRRKTEEALRAAGLTVDLSVGSSSAASASASAAAVPPPLPNSESERGAGKIKISNQNISKADMPPPALPATDADLFFKQIADAQDAAEAAARDAASVATMESSVTFRRPKDAEVIDRYRRRFPRLCNSIHLQLTENLPEFDSIEPRSDVWMVRLIEECYDEALSFISKSISDARRRKRCGLDLGALDAFPLVVQRWLTRTYSTLELRQRMCLELLLTLDNIAKIAESAALSGSFGKDVAKVNKNSGASSVNGKQQLRQASIKLEDTIKADITIDGGRATLFAKFLAEELDLDYLAMFLLARKRLQHSLGFQFKDMNPLALNEVSLPFPDPPYGQTTANAYITQQTDEKYASGGHGTATATGTATGIGLALRKSDAPSDMHGVTFIGIAEGPKTKVIPVQLPRHMGYIVDVSMPHAQLLSFNTERVQWLCEQVAPGCSTFQRDYFVQRVLSVTDKQLEASNKRLEMLLPLHAALPAECAVNGRGIAVQGERHIPVYNVLSCIMQQWKEVPPEAKGAFNASGTTAGNLLELNTFHDNDNAITKDFLQKIKKLEMQRTGTQSSIYKLDKQRRRLERKWNHGLTTEDELELIKTIRVDLVELESERDFQDSQLAGLRSRLAEVANTIENLWITAASSVEIENVDKSDPSKECSSSKLAASRWDEEVTHNLSSAIAYNFENVEAIESNKRKFASMGDVIVKSAIEHANELAAQKAKKAPEPTLHETMAAIEKEALELSRLGQSEALGLGMLPAPAPYISSYETQRVNAELARLAKEQERALEHVFQEQMAWEDKRSRYAAMYEVWMIDHRLRVAKLAQERERVERAEIIHAASLTQLKSILDAALLNMAAEAQAKRLEELAALQEQSRLYFVAHVQELTRSRIHEVVQSSLQLGVQRVCNALLERENEELARKERQAEMRRRIEATAALASSSVAVSLTTAVMQVTNAAVAELNRLHQIKLAEEHKVVRSLVVETMSFAVGADAVSIALENARIYHLEVEQARLQLEQQLLDERIETLALQALSVVEEKYVLDFDISDAIAEAVEEAIEADKREQKRLLDEALAAAKALKNLKYRIGRISKAMVKIAVDEGTIKAKSYFKDPDRLLDLEPSTWLSDETLMEVEECYLISTMIRDRLYKKALFRGLSKSRAVRSRKAVWDMRESFRLLRQRYLERTHYNKCAAVLTRFSRKYSRHIALHKFAQKLKLNLPACDTMAIVNRRKRTIKLIRWWKYWANCEKRAGLVVANICEREYMKAWMTWKYKYKLRLEFHEREEFRRRRALFKMSLVLKMYIMRRRKWRQKCIMRIVWAAKFYLARKRMVAMRRRSYLLHEYSQYIAARHTWYRTKYFKYRWQVSYNKAMFFEKMHMFLMRKLVRRKFRNWKFGAKDRGKVRLAACKKIQKTVRMWIIKRYVLNYYRWRRGLVAFQSHFRRKRCDAWFIENIHLYRSARRIQSNFRGWWLRSHHTDKRIMDLHIAAAANNYDKLLYYVRKYPELVNELDRNGNTALHNAAKNAARRTLKLLLKSGVNPNALNLAGYSALHLIIQSQAINRDDCCLYMLEKGFDENQLTPDGRSCLHLAVEKGRYKLVETLLRNGLKVNQHDHANYSPLQLSFPAGIFAITRLLVEYGADVNAPGYCGTTPLHDCIQTGDIDFPNLLISHGAHVNVAEPFHKQTPLHWACKAGLPEYVHLYIMQGAHILSIDDAGWTAAHHAAWNGNYEVYDHLRFGEADFDFPDYQGKSPLHIAAEYGNTEFCKHMLLGCANVHMQDSDGNQPSHIAARDNKLETLKMLCTYDQHIGRINYHHQTPLGIAKFHNSRDCIAFLEKHYRHVEAEGGRNEVGDIWWDRDVDLAAGEWQVRCDDKNNRWYENISTGELSASPPKYSVRQVLKQQKLTEVSMKRAVVLVNGEQENTLTRHGYLKEWDSTDVDIKALVRVFDAAACVQKFARRKLAYKKRKFLMTVRLKKRILAVFIKRHLSGFMRWKRSERNAAFSKLQAKFKGDKFRREWKRPSGESATAPRKPYPFGLYDEVLRRHKKRILGRLLLKLYRHFVWKRNVLRVEIAAKLPKNDAEWKQLIKEARYVYRTSGIYEEYKYPHVNIPIFFYRQRVSGDCTFEKPKKLAALDDVAYEERMQTRTLGCTLAQMGRIIKVQALYRGYKIRTYYTSVEAAMSVSDGAERAYMTEPDKDSSLYNYALHCHVISQDYPKARLLYAEGLRRMAYRGPDVAFLLYSYAIFSFVTHDLDYSDIVALLARARVAEEAREQQIRKAKGEGPSQAILNGTYRHGKVFDLANIGFFRKYAGELRNEKAWHSYAACRFLVYNDFATSFDAFLEAFQYAAKDPMLKANFDMMMRHFHGFDKRNLESIVRQRMMYLAQRSADFHNAKTEVRENAAKRKKAANKIKKWYKDCCNKRGFNKFLVLIRQLRANRLAGQKASAARGDK